MQAVCQRKMAFSVIKVQILANHSADFILAHWWVMKLNPVFAKSLSQDKIILPRTTICHSSSSLPAK